MSFKIKLLSLLLAVLTCISFAACTPDNPPDDGDSPDGDDFSGSISKDEENKDDDETPADEGDPETVITITTAEELRAIKRKGSYILGNDIDLGGTAWSPIGTYIAPFEGKLDGNGHKITGLKVTENASGSGISLAYTYVYGGFFGVTKGAEISNLIFEGADINVTSSTRFEFVYAGITAGLMIDTKVTSCTLNGSVTAASTQSVSAAGGLSGMAVNSNISDTSTSATVKTENSSVRSVSGGLLGYARQNTVLTNCSSNSEISAVCKFGIAYAGGISGYSDTVKFTLCTAVSNIYAKVSDASPETGNKGAAYAGGIGGIIISLSDEKLSVISKCHSSNSKISAYSVDNAAFASGIAAETDNTSYIDCYSYAEIKSESINESASAGGLFCDITNTCTVDKAFFAGKVVIDAPTTSVGTLCSAELNDEDIKKIFVNASYKTDTVFVINGSNYTKPINKNILAQGDARNSNIFYDINLLCSALGWNISDWEIKDGMIYPKI